MDYLHFLHSQSHEKFQRLQLKEDFDTITALKGLVA